MFGKARYVATLVVTPCCHHRPIASTALRNAHGVWLFNVAEDTQRYLQAQSQLGHRKIERIFITQRHPDNLLGLPGMAAGFGKSLTVH